MVLWLADNIHDLEIFVDHDCSDSADTGQVACADDAAVAGGDDGAR